MTVLFRPLSGRKLMRKAANLLRDRGDAIAPLLTMEQGKPLLEAKGEVLAGADVIDWFAEEARGATAASFPHGQRASINSW
jgi:succinate-semialdehyde dehydrogenase / glutarate-semialdehyde dehydrogenase